MVIQHNIPALNAKGFANKSVTGVKKSSEKLSSGYRINRAGDDAAGLAVSEKMRQQIRGIKQAIKNCQNGSALIQTFEGALGETVSIIHRMKGLAVEAANGEYSNEIDRKAIQIEYKQLCDEVDHIADTDFNGVVMLSGKPGVDNLKLEKVINSQDLAEIAMQKSAYSEGAEKLAAAAAAQLEEVKITRARQFSQDLTVTGTGDITFNEETGEWLLGSGDFTVSGTSRTNRIVVKKDANANVTLEDTTIYSSRNAFLIQDNSSGTVNITLKGVNMLRSGAGYAGIQKNGSDGWLHINGDGALTVWGGEYSAGIGSGNGYFSCSNIVIDGGDIYAMGGNHGAGIGGGGNGDTVANNIIINGGRVQAIGGAGTTDTGCGAGIGGGHNGGAHGITINGGIVIAQGGYCSAGIGGSLWGKSTDNININGGTVIAKGGGGGAGIGAGVGGDVSGIHISGGAQVTAIGSGNHRGIAPGIGGSTFEQGAGGNASDITVSGADTVVVSVGGVYQGDEADDIGAAKGGTENKPCTSDTPVYNDGLYKDPFTGTSNGENITNGVIIHGNGKDPLPDPPPSPYPGPGPKPPIEPDPPLEEEEPKPTPPKPDPPTQPDPPPAVRPAFTKGDSEMLYTDNLVLQTNSRTKDAVLFTFNYSAQGIGDLKNDLNCTAKGLGLNKLSLATQESANYAIDILDHALCKATMVRSTFGSAQNRLEHKVENLANMDEDLTEAESNIRDTDMALEMMGFTKSQVIMSAAQSMLAQANTQKQGVLSLLGQ